MIWFERFCRILIGSRASSFRLCVGKKRSLQPFVLLLLVGGTTQRVDLQHTPCKWLKTGVMVGGCGWQIVLFASRRRFDCLSSAFRRHFVVFSLFSRSVFDRSSIG